MRGALLACLLLSACASPFAALKAAASSGQVAIDGFNQWDAEHKRALLATHPECHAMPPDAATACYDAVLAPYIASRAAAVDKVEAVVPVLADAAAMAKQASATKPTIANMAAKVGGAVADLLAAIATLTGGAK